MGKSLEQGLQLAKLASELDRAKKYLEAISKYTESVYWLERACIEEKDVKLVQTIQQYMKSYSDRVNTLKRISGQSQTIFRQSFTSDTSRQSFGSSNSNTFINNQQVGNNKPQSPDIPIPQFDPSLLTNAVQNIKSSPILNQGLEKWKEKEIEYQNQIENLRKESSNLMKEKTELEKQKTEQAMNNSQTVTQLQKTISRLESDLNITRETVENHRRQFGLMKEGADSEKKRIQEENEKIQKKLKEQLTTTEQEKNILQNLLEEKSKQITELEEEKQRTIDSVERIGNSYLEKERKFTEELNNLHEKLQKDNQGLEHVQTMEREMFKTEKEQLERVIKTLNLQADLQKKEMETLKNEKETQSEIIQQQKTTIQELQNQFENSENKVKQLEVSKEYLEVTLKKVNESQKKEMEEKNQNQNEYVQKLKKESDHHKLILTKQVEDLKSQLQQKETAISRLNQSYNLQIDTLQKKIFQLENLEEAPLPPIDESSSSFLSDSSFLDAPLPPPVPSKDELPPLEDLTKSILNEYEIIHDEEDNNKNNKNKNKNNNNENNNKNKNNNNEIKELEEKTKKLNLNEKEMLKEELLKRKEKGEQDFLKEKELSSNPKLMKEKLNLPIDLTPKTKDSEGDPELLSGWLKKEGEGWFGSRRERFFNQDFLDRDRLHYYEDTNTKQAIGTILISSIISIKPLSNDSFELVTLHRVFKLQILSQKEPKRNLNYWLNGITQWVQRLHQKSKLKAPTTSKQEAMLKTPPPLPPTASLSQLENKFKENKKQEEALLKLIDVYYRNHDITGASTSERELENIKRQNKELELRISAFHVKIPSARKLESEDENILLPPAPLPRIDIDHNNQNNKTDQYTGKNPTWYMYETEEGIPYYYNNQTQETFWEKPDIPDEDIGFMI